MYKCVYSINEHESTGMYIIHLNIKCRGKNVAQIHQKESTPVSMCGSVCVRQIECVCITRGFISLNQAGITQTVRILTGIQYQPKSEKKTHVAKCTRIM